LEFESGKPGEGEKSSRHPRSNSGSPPYARDPVFEIAGKCARPRSMTPGSSLIHFAAPARSEPDADRTRQRASVADATLEQSSNRSRELSAAALPVSVSRHLVSTSVQFGQSAAEKTESDQWLVVAHLLSVSCAICDVGPKFVDHRTLSRLGLYKGTKRVAQRARPSPSRKFKRNHVCAISDGSHGSPYRFRQG
jgi:hypothetical protein